MSAFFDTNIVVYAVVQGDPRSARAQELISRGGATSVQVLNEFVNVLRYKLAHPWEDVLGALADIRELCPTVAPVTVETHERALEIARRYGYHIFDALVIAAALEAQCDTLYSEDMQDGQKIERLVIRNPFQA